jgi:hypothetical protein
VKVPPFTGAPPAALPLDEALVITAGALDEPPVVLALVAAALDVAAVVLAAEVVLAAAGAADDVVAAAELVVAAGAVVGVEVAPPQAARKAMPATERGANRRNWRRLIRAVIALLLL